METVRQRMRNGSLRDTCPFPLFCVHVFVCIFFFVNLDSPDDVHATRLLNGLLNTYRCQGIWNQCSMLPQNKKELQTDICAHRVLLLSKIKPVLYFQLILDRAKCICRSTHSASVSLPQHTETNSVHCSVRTYRWKLIHAENPRTQQFSYSETAFSLQMHDIWITRTFPIFVLP